ncbi:TlpA disulfide reductase family protein [Niabella aquatica]
MTKYEDTVLPELVFSDLQGKKYNTNDLKGYALYINFWSTSCGPCIAEMPDLSQLKKRYEKKKILFIGIAPEPADELQRFLKEHPFDFTIVSSDEIFQLLGIDSYPVNFFVDKKGVIKKVSTGTPVKKNPDTGKWEVSVIENYSKIIDQLM